MCTGSVRLDCCCQQQSLTTSIVLTTFLSQVEKCTELVRYIIEDLSLNWDGIGAHCSKIVIP